MKIFLSIFNLLFIALYSNAQTPDWQAYLLVDQTWNGNTDTIWFGLDYDATNGYDSGLDIMDTTFSYPLAIRLHNDQVQADSNTCAANMRRDIKAFAPEVTWDVFVKADTFTESYEEHIFLRWDTAQFNYSDGQYFLKYAAIHTTTGYIGGIDGDGYCLSWNSGSCDGEAGGLSIKVPLIYIGIQPPEYNSTFCETEEYIFKFTLHAVFDDLLDIDANTGSNIEFINQNADQVLQIRNNIGGQMNIDIFQMNGMHIFSTKTFEYIYHLDYQKLPNGYFIVRVTTGKKIPYIFSLINY